MTMTNAMKGYGRAARFKAEAVSHQMKDRVLEKRLDRANSEADRLRFENEMLRDEVEGARSEHRRILDMLEERLPENGEGRSHKGRWMLFLVALGGGAYAIMKRMREDGAGWESSTGTTTGASGSTTT
jgi:hypothetical protein